MRHPVPAPANTLDAPLHPDADAVARFNALVHELYRDAPRVDANAIASAARWLDSQAPDAREQLLAARRLRIAELEAMRRDAEWPLDSVQERRIDLVLHYLEDDALLLELAWPVFAEDVEDYRDFRQFREECGESLGRAPHQLDWLRARAEQGALWEQMHRAHDQQHAEHRQSRIFRAT
jgi:hypothetical protein